MNIESVRWLCYADKSTAQKAYKMLKAAQLGGPGKVELRHNPKVPIGWWVVTYNIICSTSYELSRVYGIPECRDTDSWFPYQGPRLLEHNTQASRLIESFDVLASVEGLLNASQRMGDEPYLCHPGKPNITCSEEANKRLETIRQDNTYQEEANKPVKKTEKKWWQFWK